MGMPRILHHLSGSSEGSYAISSIYPFEYQLIIMFLYNFHLRTKNEENTNQMYSLVIFYLNQFMD